MHKNTLQHFQRGRGQVPLLAHAVGAHGASYTIGVARGAVPRVRTPKFVGLSLGGYVVSSPPPPSGRMRSQIFWVGERGSG